MKTSFLSPFWNLIETFKIEFFSGITRCDDKKLDLIFLSIKTLMNVWIQTDESLDFTLSGHAIIKYKRNT